MKKILISYILLICLDNVVRCQPIETEAGLFYDPIKDSLKQEDITEFIDEEAENLRKLKEESRKTYEKLLSKLLPDFGIKDQQREKLHNGAVWMFRLGR